MMLVIPAVSHLDHNLTPEHVAWLVARFANRSEFFIETVMLPDHLGEVDLGLYGPQVGDEPVAESDVSYVRRGDRKGLTRVINKPKRKTRQLTVIAGPTDDHPCVLYTAYGGPCAPREPWDTTIGSWEQVLESRAYWATHALTAE